MDSSEIQISGMKDTGVPGISGKCVGKKMGGILDVFLIFISNFLSLETHPTMVEGFYIPYPGPNDIPPPNAGCYGLFHNWKEGPENLKHFVPPSVALLLH